MTSPDPGRQDADARVQRHVRRAVGLKVMRDLSRWASNVERDHAQRPRLIAWLLALILAVVAVTWLVLGTS